MDRAAPPGALTGPRLGIDRQRICVSGNSAGAHLALMTSATPGFAPFEGDGGHAGESTACAATIAIYPPTRLAGGEKLLGGPIAALFGSGVDEQTLHEASPLHWVAERGAALPPTLLIHGNADAIVPVDHSESLYRALASTGADVELHVFNAAPHAFDTDPALGRQCAALMALFLDRHVPAASTT